MEKPRGTVPPLPNPSPAEGGGAEACPSWVVEFLATLIVSGSVKKAVANAGIEFETAWALRRGEEDFAYYWDKAVRLHRSGAMAALASGKAGTMQ